MTNDELVKRLRTATTLPVMNALCQEAADAIEELRKKYLASEVDATNLTGWLAEEHAKHLWIPVTERLPEEKTNVLCCGANGGMFVGWTGSNVFEGKVRAFVHGGSGRNITHWMPLPQPPKESEP